MTSILNDIGTILFNFTGGFCGYLGNQKTALGRNMDLRDASASKKSSFLDFSLYRCLCFAIEILERVAALNWLSSGLEGRVNVC